MQAIITDFVLMPHLSYASLALPLRPNQVFNQGSLCMYISAKQTSAAPTKSSLYPATCS